MSCQHCLGRILREAGRLPQLEAASPAPPPVRTRPLTLPGLKPGERNPLQPERIRPLPGDPRGPVWVGDDPPAPPSRN